MCFHEKAVRSRWCLSPVLKCSVGTLGALCTIACKFKRKRAVFMEGTLDLPAHLAYVIFKHIPLTKWHCPIVEAYSLYRIFWLWYIKPCVCPPAQNNWKFIKIYGWTNFFFRSIIKKLYLLDCICWMFCSWKEDLFWQHAGRRKKL